MMHEHQWVRLGSAAGTAEVLWGPSTCTVCGAVLAEPDRAVTMTGNLLLRCPRLGTAEHALDCNACPYYRGLGGPRGRGYVRCAWGQP